MTTLLLTTILSLLINVIAQPSMVYIINRHGVIQTRDTTTYEGGALLLNTSYERLYQKGSVIRNLYPGLLSPTYKTTEVRFNSSSWERSITTTQGIITGLYPTQNNFTANIPVYSTPWENDYTLYNYDKCPNYNTALAAFFASAEFQNKVIYYSNLTTAINAIVNPSTPITLQNIYTTWNMYWLSINRPESGQTMPPISMQLYSLLTEATNYVETKKMSVQVAGTYFGSTLLNAIKYRTDMFIKGNTVFGHKMIMSTSHYPNILGLFASLGYTGPKSQTIPDYNAMVVFELYNNGVGLPNGTGWSLQVKYYDGEWNNVPINLYSLGLGSCNESIVTSCSHDYLTFWNTYRLKNLTQFCMDCGSTLPICIGSVVSNNIGLLQTAVNYIVSNNTVVSNNTIVYNNSEQVISITKILSNGELHTIEGIVSSVIAMLFVVLVLNVWICTQITSRKQTLMMYNPTGSANV